MQFVALFNELQARGDKQKLCSCLVRDAKTYALHTKYAVIVGESAAA